MSLLFTTFTSKKGESQALLSSPDKRYKHVKYEMILKVRHNIKNNKLYGGTIMLSKYIIQNTYEAFEIW
jgi:hypothetical protein